MSTKSLRNTAIATTLLAAAISPGLLRRQGSSEIQVVNAPAPVYVDILPNPLEPYNSPSNSKAGAIAQSTSDTGKKPAGQTIRNDDYVKELHKLEIAGASGFFILFCIYSGVLLAKMGIDFETKW